MEAVWYPALDGTADGLVILLPGIADTPETFVENAFVDIVHAATSAFDVVAVDAHLGYYRDRSIVERLHADVIGPSIGRYRRVWLVGISLGGLGATAYAMEHPVDGLMLLAPYLGPSDVVDSIHDAGGLAHWTPPDLRAVDEPLERLFYEIWDWYRGYVRPDGTRPDLYLGYGRGDRLARSNALLGSVLPADRTLILSGRHDWTTWRTLFAELARRAIGDASATDVSSNR